MSLKVGDLRGEEGGFIVEGAVAGGDFVFEFGFDALKVVHVFGEVVVGTEGVERVEVLECVALGVYDL